jgi:hypothetical protein
VTVRRYLVGAWTAIWAGLAIAWVVLHGGASVWLYTLTACYAAAVTLLRDRWRSKYLDLKAGPKLPPPVPPRSIRLRPEDGGWPAPPGDETQEWPGGGPWQP